MLITQHCSSLLTCCDFRRCQIQSRLHRCVARSPATTTVNTSHHHQPYYHHHHHYLEQTTVTPRTIIIVTITINKITTTITITYNNHR